MSVAIIGGTGLSDLAGVTWEDRQQPETPFGPTSGSLRLGRLGDQRLVFLGRHGDQHSIAPHRVNYRANLWALKEAGVEQVIAVNAVGGLTERMAPEKLVVPDQIIDYTWGREHTFYDGIDGALQHIDFGKPYSPALRQRLVAAACSLGLDLIEGGVYACTQGPRLETAAEIRRCIADGCDLVGMTAMPEAALARELQLEYASVCLVVNWGAGLCEEEITLEAIAAVVERGSRSLGHLLLTCLRQMSVCNH